MNEMQYHELLEKQCREEPMQDLLCALKYDRFRTLRFYNESFLRKDRTVLTDHALQIVEMQDANLIPVLRGIAENADVIQWEPYISSSFWEFDETNVAILNDLYECVWTWMLKMEETQRDDVFFSMMRNAGLTYQGEIVCALARFLSALLFSYEERVLVELADCMSIRRPRPADAGYERDRVVEFNCGSLQDKYADRPVRVHLTYENMMELVKGMELPEYLCFSSFMSALNRQCEMEKGYSLILEENDPLMFESTLFDCGLNLDAEMISRRVELLAGNPNVDGSGFAKIPLEEHEREWLIRAVHQANWSCSGAHELECMLRLVLLFPEGYDLSAHMKGGKSDVSES